MWTSFKEDKKEFLEKESSLVEEDIFSSMDEAMFEESFLEEEKSKRRVFSLVVKVIREVEVFWDEFLLSLGTFLSTERPYWIFS